MSSPRGLCYSKKSNALTFASNAVSIFFNFWIFKIGFKKPKILLWKISYYFVQNNNVPTEFKYCTRSHYVHFVPFLPQYMR